jgi:hypothetical protein
LKTQFLIIKPILNSHSMTKIRKIVGILTEIDTATNQIIIDGKLYNVDQQKTMAVNQEEFLLAHVIATLYDDNIVAVIKQPQPPAEVQKPA